VYPIILKLSLQEGADFHMVSIDINASLIWQFVNFIILILVLNAILYKPIRSIIKERTAKFTELDHDISTNKKNVEAKIKQLEKCKLESHRLGAQLLENLKNEGRAKERELIKNVNKEMEHTINETQSKIALEISKARKTLKNQVQSFGVEIAQKILGRSIQ